MSYGVAEIAADGKASTSCSARSRDGLLGFRLRAEVGDGDVGAAFGERERDGAADALGRPVTSAVFPVSGLSMASLLRLIVAGGWS